MGSLVGIAFSPVGRVVLAAVAFFVWLGFHDAKVANRARGECQAEQLRKTLTEVERQRDAAETALKNAENQSQATEAELAELKKATDDVVADLKDAGKSSCRIPRAALDRLRAIR